MSAALRLATRRSPLALAQAGTVATAVRERTGREVDLVAVVTRGDTEPGAVQQIGGTGVFTGAVRDAVLAGDADFAVHSLKDLPTAAADRLVLAAVPPREDPRDALVCPAGLLLGELAPGSRIGTGSPRRAAQLRALGLGLQIVPLRGNVETRVRRAGEEGLEAVVLARAGLARLGLLEAISETLDPAVLLPAPGQGALAVECRAGDQEVLDALRGVDDAPSRAAVTAERALLAALEAGCTAPVGALADTADGEVYLRAVVAAPDGSSLLRQSVTGPVGEAHSLGYRLAERMLEAGAADLMETDRG